MSRRGVLQVRAMIGIAVMVGLPGCAKDWGHRLRSVPIAAIGTRAGAAWTSTTLESASTPTQRKALAQARPGTIVGEVVDISCFLQLGKRGEAHIPCGQKCLRNGQPIGLLTDDGQLYLVLPEEHHPRRDGQVSLKERFAELMAKRVALSGMIATYRGYRAIFVRTRDTPS